MSWVTLNYLFELGNSRLVCGERSVTIQLSQGIFGFLITVTYSTDLKWRDSSDQTTWSRYFSAELVPGHRVLRSSPLIPQFLGSFLVFSRFCNGPITAKFTSHHNLVLCLRGVTVTNTFELWSVSSVSWLLIQNCTTRFASVYILRQHIQYRFRLIVICVLILWCIQECNYCLLSTACVRLSWNNSEQHCCKIRPQPPAFPAPSSPNYSPVSPLTFDSHR